MYKGWFVWWVQEKREAGEFVKEYIDKLSRTVFLKGRAEECVVTDEVWNEEIDFFPPK